MRISVILAEGLTVAPMLFPYTAVLYEYTVHVMDVHTQTLVCTLCAITHLMSNWIMVGWWGGRLT